MSREVLALIHKWTALTVRDEALPEGFIIKPIHLNYDTQRTSHESTPFEYSLTGVNIPILKDGNEVNLDFHIVSEDGIVKHIEMIEK